MKRTIQAKNHGSGYRGVGPNRGRWVPQTEALAWACHRCGLSLPNPQAPLAQPAAQLLTDWYFSGNWTKEDDDESNQRS